MVREVFVPIAIGIWFSGFQAIAKQKSFLKGLKTQTIISEIARAPQPENPKTSRTIVIDIIRKLEIEELRH